MSVQMLNRSFRGASAILLLLSLCAPTGGVWFSGLLMLVTSLFAVAITLAGGGAGLLSVPGAWALVLLVLPTYNLPLVYALMRMHPRSYMPSFALRSALTLMAIHAAVMLAMLSGLFATAPFALWTASLLCAASAMWMQTPAALELALEPGYQGD